MRRLIAIMAVMMLLSLNSGWAFAGTKVELTENEMDDINAAGAAGPVFGLEVLLLQFRSIGFTSNGQTSITVNGFPQPVVTQPKTPSSNFHPVALVTKTTSLGSQSGLPGVGLIQSTKSNIVGFNTPLITHLVPH